MDIETAKVKFRELQSKMHAYNHAASMLYYDAVTAAPSDTAEGRGKTMAVLSEVIYELSSGDEARELAACLLANKDAIEPQLYREAEVFNRDIEYTSSIPKDEYIAYTVLINEAENVWHKAKAASDFSMFAPYLEKIVETNRRFALYYKPDQKPYDTLLNMYERGLTMEKADEFFGSLRASIVPLIKEVAAAKQVDDSFLNQPYAIEKQKQLSDWCMATMCIDRSHCGIGETEHPFTINFNRNDVRITTHYHEDAPMSSMYSVIHEGGHALYELHVGAEYDDTVLGGGVSMGIHESQSRFFENLVGRSEAFVSLLHPYLCGLFPQQMEGVSQRQLYEAVNKSECSLIRTEADELTYALHIMVRYELEKALIAGELEVSQLPEAWNAKYKEYLGVDVPDDAHGVLQDSHWSGGSIGYFPSYALGSAYGAQIIDRMGQDLDVDKTIRSGDLQPMVDWLTEHIWRHGGMYDPAVLLEMCCGKPFDPSYFVKYLEKKYKDIYKL